MVVTPLANESGRRIAQRRPAGPSRARIAANDDAPSIGGLIYALNQRPSNRAYLWAGIASGVWAAIALGFGALLVAPEVSSGKGLLEVLVTPSALTAFATLVVPISVFWFLAMLSWRAEELKLRSSAMTEVALRLAEPDKMAEQQVASLGQSVRRQVSFMNDAVSRALGRAGELEALVHNEVSALERSYDENEKKIRSLIQELAGERTALLSTSDKVSDTLKDLGTEIPTLIEKLSSQQIKLARIIEGAGQNLTALEGAIATQTGRLETQLGSRTDQLQNVLEGYSNKLEGQLGSRTEQLQNVLEGYTGALGMALEQRTNQMQGVFNSQLTAIDSQIGDRTQHLQAVFEEYARALDTTLATRASALDNQMVERTRALDNAFNERLRLFDESILRSTIAIDGAVTERTRALTSAMETHVKTISDSIGTQAIALDESLLNGISSVRRTSESITKQSLKAIEGLAGQADLLKNVSENIFSQISGVTNRFENQGQSIIRAANALETANYKIDQTLQQRHADLNSTLGRLATKADEFGETIQGYHSSLEGSMTAAEQRARALTDELRRDAETKSLTTIAEIERLKQQASGETDRALSDLRSQFSAVTKEVSERLGTMTNQFDQTSNQLTQRTTAVASQLEERLGSLGSQFDRTSSELREKTALAATDLEREQTRLKTQLDRLPATTRESAEAMRRALQDQLAALDQISSLTSREVARGDVARPQALQAAPSQQRAALPNDVAHAQLQPQQQAPGQDRSRALNSLSSSLMQELSQRQRPVPSATPAQGAQPGPPAGSGQGQPQYAAQTQPNPHQPGPQSAPMQQAQMAAGALDGNGWSLGDLLTRASRDELAAHGQGQGQAGAQSGSGLNVEVISRALDPATAAGLWSRLRSGQRGIMVRSIYSDEGRAAFDELARRVRVDAAFQRTVNRYIGEFEQMVRENEARDPSGRLVQSQLISETGRVYLFLAHAVGHIS